MPRKIKLKIFKTDFAQAGTYGDTTNCLLCRAVRRHFKLPASARVAAGGYDVEWTFKNGKTREFCLSDSDGRKISNSYFHSRKFPFTVTLIPNTDPNG